MLKKIVFVILMIIICSFTYIHITNSTKPVSDIKETLDNSKFFHAKMAFVANSLDEIYKKSPLIIEATVGENIGDIEFGPDAYFTFTEVKVKDVIKGDGINQNDTLC